MRRIRRLKLFSINGKRQEKQTGKNKEFPGNRLWIVVCAAIMIMAAVAVPFLVSLWSNNEAGGNEDLIHTTQPAAEPSPAVSPVPDTDPDPVQTPEPEPTPTAPQETLPTPEPTPVPDENGIREPDRIIDFEDLLNRNGDVIAWINVPGTEINYPVVISRDNYEYLSRDLDGNHSSAGTVFIDMINLPDFTERVTVLYGHNMKNGTKFAGLHRFRDVEFFKENRELKLYMPEGMRIYDIIAAYVTDDNNILYQTDYSDDTVWEAYIGKIFGNTDPRANLYVLSVGEDDLILTLSTCVAGRDDQRYLVQGLLRKGN